MKLNNPRRIAILLATYNGGKYLQEQIDSILTQSNTDWTLYIQDDGSTDATREVISRAAENHSDQIVFTDIGLTAQGCCCNFMSLLNRVESQYYMFCDQDDVWLPEKIELSVARMRELEDKYSGNTPILIHTDRSFVDQNLKLKRQSEWNPGNQDIQTLKRKIEGLETSNILAIYSICAGNTMLFNRAAKQVSFPFLNIRMHDSTLAMKVSNCHGVISAVYEPTVLYRIHENQTCGVRDNRLLPKLLRLPRTFSANMMGYYLWKIYGKGSFLKFLYYRCKYFYLLRK